MIYIKQKDYTCIVQHCIDSLPNEACGLLGGIRKDACVQVEKVYLMKNADASSRHFSMYPEEQFAAVKDMRKYGYVMVGNFHSHPSSASMPSKEDINLAYDSLAYYLILSLADQKHPVLRAFAIDEEKNVSRKEIIYV